MHRYLYYLFFILIASQGFATEDLPPLITPDQVIEQPQEPTTEKFFFEFLRMMAILGLLLGILLFLSWMLKRILNTRMEQVNTSSPIKVLDRRSLTAKTSLFVLDVHGKKCVITESLNGVTYLGDIPSETNSSFGEFLDKK